ncbi:Molybdenum cofactor biosynthesis protein B [Desulfamplus magnetovallimortis]|uniref:Molybdenum cofactor biosynthesis protein B n=1 Tax=Desulfamplus magnetovallimortis TaxID=1246637 RepID=A0A1W1HDK4_9BACT|nr:MogA/MoaB family molybdenum cofactor biosynthesis protein [Desulfamplus magnetovallimortis]SLM30455.1 Molybdenum cofactor biosynthesis protein B [Desulfamplus magnetovallimortis]
MGTLLHKKNMPENLKIAVISVSTTRSIKEDKSGEWIKKQAAKEGHETVLHLVVTDEIEAIRDMVTHVVENISPHAILLSGGTGISPRDVTIEAVTPLFEKTLTAFGILFAQLSFEEIDSAAILSRATAGIIGRSVLFCMPGSIKACKLACNSLIFPELGHIVKHISEK